MIENKLTTQFGLMGALADAALECGTSVIGVMPEFLMAKEVAHRGLTEIKVTTSMHERKAVMAELSSAFIALPGGMGTMEEFFEVLTWGQLGLHGKPCGLLNVNGYYDSILGFLDNAVAQRLLSARHRSSVLSASAPAELLDQIEAYQPIFQPKWL